MIKKYFDLSISWLNEHTHISNIIEQCISSGITFIIGYFLIKYFYRFYLHKNLMLKYLGIEPDSNSTQDQCLWNAKLKVINLSKTDLMFEKCYAVNPRYGYRSLCDHIIDLTVKAGSKEEFIITLGISEVVTPGDEIKFYLQSIQGYTFTCKVKINKQASFILDFPCANFDLNESITEDYSAKMESYRWRPIIYQKYLRAIQIYDMKKFIFKLWFKNFWIRFWF